MQRLNLKASGMKKTNKKNIFFICFFFISFFVFAFFPNFKLGKKIKKKKKVFFLIYIFFP